MRFAVAVICIIGVLLAISCSSPPPPAVMPVTREVAVTREVESIREIEVIREIIVEVEVTREVPVTRLVTPTRHASVQPVDQTDDVELRVIAINDFHGHIATSSDSFGGVGRADYLASNVAAARAGAKNSVFVSAGDLIGGSPLVSALFHDEPTIEAMNLMGLEFNAVGNHEFDEGLAELRRMQHGGAHPVDRDLDGDPFGGADFQFLAANVIEDATGSVIFPPYAVRDYQGIKVAFIGMTLEGTPNIVARTYVEGLSFTDEVETVNALMPRLQEEGIEAIVVLLHEGGLSDGGQDDCGSGLTGPVAEVSAMLDDAVDLVIAGHTNDEFVCEIAGKWVTMADNRGRLFTVIDATLHRDTGDLTVREISNQPNSHDGISPDPELTELIDRYETLAAPLANTVIGIVTTDIARRQSEAGESALGNLIADAQLAATRNAENGGADVAFMNQGGIRDDILFSASGDEADGELTFGEAFAIHPFGNSLVTMSLTAAQIDELLESQFAHPEAGARMVLQVSDGFQYAWDAAQPVGSRVAPASITFDGVAIDLDATYRVTVNSFLAEGGDGFNVLTEGVDRVGGEIDLDALLAYFASQDSIAPSPRERITRVN